MVTSAELEGLLSTEDGLEIDIKLTIRDPHIGEADVAAQDLMDLMNNYVDAQDEDPDPGEQLPAIRRDNVLAFARRVA